MEKLYNKIIARYDQVILKEDQIIDDTTIDRDEQFFELAIYATKSIEILEIVKIVKEMYPDCSEDSIQYIDNLLKNEILLLEKCVTGLFGPQNI